MNRRYFLENFSRYALLGGLIFVSGFLWKNRKIYPSENCSLSPVCSHCTKFRTCEKVAEVKTQTNGK